MTWASLLFGAGCCPGCLRIGEQFHATSPRVQRAPVAVKVLEVLDDDGRSKVHRVPENELPNLLGGADAAWWLLRFGFFGRRWVLVP